MGSAGRRVRRRLPGRNLVCRAKVVSFWMDGQSELRSGTISAAAAPSFTEIPFNWGLFATFKRRGWWSPVTAAESLYVRRLNTQWTTRKSWVPGCVNSSCGQHATSRNLSLYLKFRSEVSVLNFCGKVRAQRDKSNRSKDLPRLRVFWERPRMIWSATQSGRR